MALKSSHAQVIAWSGLLGQPHTIIQCTRYRRRLKHLLWQLAIIIAASALSCIMHLISSSETVVGPQPCQPYATDMPLCHRDSCIHILYRFKHVRTLAQLPATLECFSCVSMTVTPTQTSILLNIAELV